MRACMRLCVHAIDGGVVGKIRFEIHRGEKRLDGPFRTLAAVRLRRELRTSYARHGTIITHTKNRVGYECSPAVTNWGGLTQTTPALSSCEKGSVLVTGVRIWGLGFGD